MLKINDYTESVNIDSSRLDTRMKETNLYIMPTLVPHLGDNRGLYLQNPPLG